MAKTNLPAELEGQPTIKVPMCEVRFRQTVAGSTGIAGVVISWPHVEQLLDAAGRSGEHNVVGLVYPTALAEGMQAAPWDVARVGKQLKPVVCVDVLNLTVEVEPEPGVNQARPEAQAYRTLQKIARSYNSGVIHRAMQAHETTTEYVSRAQWRASRPKK